MFEMAKAIAMDARRARCSAVRTGARAGSGVLAFVGKQARGRVGAGVGPARKVASAESLGITKHERRHLVRAEARKAGLQKPKAAKLSAGITVIGGFGFPGRFVEEGTIKTRAHPFLTPALMPTLPGVEGFVKAACAKHRIISAHRAAIGDTFQAARAVTRAAARAAGG